MYAESFKFYTNLETVWGEIYSLRVIMQWKGFLRGPIKKRYYGHTMTTLPLPNLPPPHFLAENFKMLHSRRLQFYQYENETHLQKQFTKAKLHTTGNGFQTKQQYCFS